MAITVIMQESRPDGAGGNYKKGSTYTLPDDLATYFIGQGLARRQIVRSEQTGATIDGDSAARFPSAPALDDAQPAMVKTSSDGGVRLAPVGNLPVIGLNVCTAEVPVATFGDSTSEQTAGGPTDVEAITDAIPASGVTSKGINYTRMAVQHFYPMAAPVADGGIGGQITSEMLARDTLAASSTRKAIADVLDKRPKAVIYRGGSINNMTRPSQITEANYASVVATVYAEHCQVIERLRSGGAWVIDEGFLGYSAATATYPDVVRRAILELNAKFAAYAQSVEGVVFLPSPLCDSAGNYLPNMSNDGVHQNMNGSRILGKWEAMILERIFGRSAAIRFPGKNLLTNALFANVTGGVPTGVVYAFNNAALSNQQIRTINGRRYATCDVTPFATSNVGSITYTFDPSAWGLLAGDTIGFEVDFLVQPLDGSPLIPTDYTAFLKLNKTGAGSLYANEYRASATAGKIDGEFNDHVSYKMALSDPSSALMNTCNIYLKYQTDSLAPYRIGIAMPRIVKL